MARLDIGHGDTQPKQDISKIVDGKKKHRFEIVEPWLKKINTNTDEAKRTLDSLRGELNSETYERWDQHLTSTANQANKDYMETRRKHFARFTWRRTDGHDDRAKASVRLEDLHKKSQGMVSALRSMDTEIIKGYVSDPVDVNSIRPEHIDRGIDYLKSQNEKLEEIGIFVRHEESQSKTSQKSIIKALNKSRKTEDPESRRRDEENRSKAAQNSIIAAISVLNDFKKIGDTESRQIFWNYISEENILNNTYLRYATCYIKNSTRYKEQNTNVSDQEILELENPSGEGPSQPRRSGTEIIEHIDPLSPPKLETSPGEGSSQPQGPSIEITEHLGPLLYDASSS